AGAALAAAGAALAAAGAALAAAEAKVEASAGLAVTVEAAPGNSSNSSNSRPRRKTAAAKR
ncbi:MAG: hypothetical protein M3Y54_19470, partial [Bacteroidota bacterium]|nr:hypothetical protein [Bacteroidota bacterium]